MRRHWPQEVHRGSDPQLAERAGYQLDGDASSCLFEGDRRRPQRPHIPAQDQRCDQPHGRQHHVLHGHSDPGRSPPHLQPLQSEFWGVLQDRQPADSKRKHF